MSLELREKNVKVNSIYAWLKISYSKLLFGEKMHGAINTQ